MDNLYINIGHLLRQFRNEKGFSQRYVCKKLGIGQKTIDNYEKGEIRLPLDKFKTICNFYGREPHKVLEMAEKLNEKV